MANTFKNIRKKIKKKKNMAKKTKLAREQGAAMNAGSMDYDARLARHRKKAMRKLIVTTGAIAAAIFLVLFYVEKRSYRNYRVIEFSDQEDIISTQYTEIGGKILRYSSDNVSLVDNRLQTEWSATYEMQNPVADVCGNKAVIADRDGTSLYILDKKDQITGSVTTSYAIVKAKISSSGMVAAILDAGDDTWINFYSPDGSLIAENQTKVEDPGFPMDIAVSGDGKVMMVTYQFVDGGDTTSYVAFYNFGEVGQNEENRIVSGYTYEGTVIPQVQYLDGSHAAALKDNGFTVYSGKQIPKESETVKKDKEIVSTFFDDENIGLVFKNDSKDKQYIMEVYSLAGKLKFTKEFNVKYTAIRMSGGNILMHNSAQICVMNGRGVEKYLGTIDGTVKDFFSIGLNRYLLVLDNGVNVIKLT